MWKGWLKTSEKAIFQFVPPRGLYNCSAGGMQYSETLNVQGRTTKSTLALSILICKWSQPKYLLCLTIFFHANIEDIPHINYHTYKLCYWDKRIIVQSAIFAVWSDRSMYWQSPPSDTQIPVQYYSKRWESVYRVHERGLSWITLLKRDIELEEIWVKPKVYFFISWPKARWIYRVGDGGRFRTDNLDFEAVATWCSLYAGSIDAGLVS